MRFVFLFVFALIASVLATRHTRDTSIGVFCVNKNMGEPCADYYLDDTSNIDSVLEAGLTSFNLTDNGYVWYLEYIISDNPLTTAIWTFRGGVTEDLTNFPNMNDAVTTAAPFTASGNPAATLYENSNYGGRSAYYEIGSYSSMSSSGYECTEGAGTIGASSLSSVALFDNADFIYYKSTNFVNEITYYTSSTTQVTDNDQCNSFIIEAY